MRNCFPGPQAHIFQCKGQLHLEGEALVFTSPWQTRVAIPLQAISDLSIGQFQMWTTPWVMKYARFHFLSITKWLAPDRPVATMAPLLHRHFEVRIGLRLLADRSGGHSLQFSGRAAGGRCKYTWRWSPAVVASWHRISSSLRGGVTDWDG